MFDYAGAIRVPFEHNTHAKTFKVPVTFDLKSNACVFVTHPFCVARAGMPLMFTLARMRAACSHRSREIRHSKHIGTTHYSLLMRSAAVCRTDITYIYASIQQQQFTSRSLVSRDRAPAAASNGTIIINFLPICTLVHAERRAICCCVKTRGGEMVACLHAIACVTERCYTATTRHQQRRWRRQRQHEDEPTNSGPLALCSDAPRSRTRVYLAKQSRVSHLVRLLVGRSGGGCGNVSTRVFVPACVCLVIIFHASVIFHGCVHKNTQTKSTTPRPVSAMLAMDVCSDVNVCAFILVHCVIHKIRCYYKHARFVVLHIVLSMPSCSYNTYLRCVFTDRR